MRKFLTYYEIMEGLKDIEKFLQEKGYNVYSVMLKGSQNYNVSDASSDLDAIAIVIPTIEQLCRKRDISLKHTVDGIGEVTVNDLFTFSHTASKGNPAWIETIHTKYKTGKLDLFEHYKINPRALKGMALEKQKALCKRYPSRVEWVDKYGFDPKQLHHIYRLCDITFKAVEAYGEIPPIHAYYGLLRLCMMEIKRKGGCLGNVFTKEQATEYAEACIIDIENNIKDIPTPKNEQPFEAMHSIIERELIKTLNEKCL